MSDEVRDDGEYQNDTIMFAMVNDTLKVTVGINYTCCSSMSANDVLVDGTNVTLTISDVTKNPDQYCRCDCYYVFEYFFTDTDKERYTFNLFFDSPFDEKDVHLTANTY